MSVSRGAPPGLFPVDKSYAYDYWRSLSDLYLAEGLR